jgi:hypothetical protein
VGTKALALVHLEGHHVARDSRQHPDFVTKSYWLVSKGLLEAVLPKIFYHGLVMGELLLRAVHLGELGLQVLDEESYLLESKEEINKIIFIFTKLTDRWTDVLTERYSGNVKERIYLKERIFISQPQLIIFYNF